MTDMAQLNGYWRGIDQVLDAIEDEVAVLENEHRALSPNWLGRPRRRHNEIIIQVRALSKIHKAIVSMAVE